MEETLVIIKPDAYKAGLSGEIIKRYEYNDLKIRALKLVELDENIVCEHYKEHLGKSYYDKLIKFMLSAPCIVMVLSGENAIEKVRAINGATDPKKASKGTIRADFAQDVTYNIVHASDGKKNARREIELFFKYEELKCIRGE